MIQIHCRGEVLELCYTEGRTPKEIVMQEYGWLLNPIIKIVGSYSEALNKLNWKVVETK